jgi:hypothetical protein
MIGLFKGGIFKGVLPKLNKLEVEVFENKDENNKKDYLTEWFKIGCLPVVVMGILAVIEIIYLIKALEIDTYKYPTIAVVALFILSIAASKKKKKLQDMNQDELNVYKYELSKPAKRSFLQVVRSFLWVIYFGYMFYILVF